MKCEKCSGKMVLFRGPKKKVYVCNTMGCDNHLTEENDIENMEKTKECKYCDGQSVNVCVECGRYLE